MKKKISFCSSVNENQADFDESKTTKPRHRKTLTSSRRNSLNYTQTKAELVAARIELEVKNPHSLGIRQREETVVEHLLALNKFHSKINKVYRLSDTSLNVLKIRLLANRKNCQ